MKANSSARDKSVIVEPAYLLYGLVVGCVGVSILMLGWEIWAVVKLWRRERRDARVGEHEKGEEKEGERNETLYALGDGGKEGQY